METAIVARFRIDHCADGFLLDRSLIYRPSSCHGIVGTASAVAWRVVARPS